MMQQPEQVAIAIYDNLTGTVLYRYVNRSLDGGGTVRVQCVAAYYI